MWNYGVLKRERKLFRQVPVKHVWSSTLWISRDGECFRRFYNPIAHAWTWSDDAQCIVLDEHGRAGLQILNQWTPLTTVIALAWIPRKPGSPMRTRLVADGARPIAKNIRWLEMAEHRPEPRRLKDETWSGPPSVPRWGLQLPKGVRDLDSWTPPEG